MFDPGRLFRALESHKVRYLVVGGISARAFGAQRRTYDLDCIPEPSTANITALTAALRQFDARLRIDRVSDAESRELPVDVEHVVRTQEVSLWQTDAGPIDVLHASDEIRHEAGCCSPGNATRCCGPCSSALGLAHRADRGDRAQVLDQHPVDGESALA